MRESISNQERVSQKSKVKSQIASRQHVWRTPGLHPSTLLGVTLSLSKGHGPLCRGVKLLRLVERTLQRARSCPWLAAALLMAAPASALACPVCGLVGSSDNTWAYQVMSAMLTLLPLAMIGATVWWLARLVARTERQPATQHIADRAPVGGTETYAVVEARAPLVRLKPDTTYSGGEGSLALAEGQVHRRRAVDR